MTLKLENSHFIVRETHKSSRGGAYVYVVRDSKLVHISKFFNLTSKEYDDIIYKIPIQEAKAVLGQNVEFIEFSFSRNKGNFFIWNLIVDFQTKTLTERSLKNREIHRQYEFEIFGEEYPALKEYEMKVPPLIKKVWEIEEKLNLDVHIRGARGKEVHENPELAKFNSLVFPNPRSRTRSLKEKIQFAHELYVLMLVIEAMLKETPEKRSLRITHEEESTLVIKDVPLTVWYQFPIEDWFEVVKRGVIALFEGTKIKRSHVKPDIMIFKGEYNFRSDLLENPPERDILIDAKVKMTKNDLEQLLDYKDSFSETFENTEFIVAAIGGIPANYRYKLEHEGYRVIENVFPGKPGEKEFQGTIRSIIETWEE